MASAKQPAYTPKDEFEEVLLHWWVRLAFQGKTREARNIEHLWRGYRAGITQDEVMERVDAGEVTR